MDKYDCQIFWNKCKIRFIKSKLIWLKLPYNLKVFVYCLLASIGILLFTGFLWQAVIIGIIIYLSFRKKNKGVKHGKSC